MERGAVDALCLDTLANHHYSHNHRGMPSVGDNLDLGGGRRTLSNQSSLRMRPSNRRSNILSDGYCKTGRCAIYNRERARRGRTNRKYSLLVLRSMGSAGGQLAGNAASADESDDIGSSSDLESFDDEANATNSTRESNATNVTTTMSNEDASRDAPSAEETTAASWRANDFESDYRLLETAMARQSAMTDLQQKQRKHTLDYGFARNRRPLVRDLLRVMINIGGWTAFLVGGGVGGGVDGVVRAWNQRSWRCKLHALAANVIVTMTTLHHWIVGVALPLLLLALVKRERLGPAGRTLDEYFTPKSSSDDAPSFFYTSKRSKEKARAKGTDDFALCLLENWSSAVAVPFVCGIHSTLASAGKSVGNIQICARLLARLGAAAALHQYPSLLFELRRADRPRPLCGPTAYMQRAVKSMLRWLPLGVAADLAVVAGNRSGGFGAARSGALAASLLSTIIPLFHLIALGRIVRVSRCSAASLSEASSFPPNDENAMEGDATTDERKKVTWRYLLRWRTPQRIAVTLQSWANYFLTGHESLLLEMDEWKMQPLRFDEFSTEGAHFSLSALGKERKTSDVDDSTPRADAIAESLSLILRDRDAAIRNATQARYDKHQESYDAKALDDVLGVAVQRTFGIGLSYQFNHFDPPPEGEEPTIHQLRARMAKSAVRRKKELDRSMEIELGVLRRLKENVVTV